MRIETDRYSFDEAPGVTKEVVDKTIDDIEKDYKSSVNQLLKEQYVNNRINNQTGKAIDFKFVLSVSKPATRTSPPPSRHVDEVDDEEHEDDDEEDGGADGSIERFLEDHGDEVSTRAAEIVVRERKLNDEDGHDFVQLETGSGVGCDYTIGCGFKFDDVGTGRGDDVEAISNSISRAMEHYGSDRYEDVEIVEVVHRFSAFDVIERAAKEIIAEANRVNEEKREVARKVEEEERALQKEEEEKNREKVERDLFDQLKVKYEKKEA